MSASLSQPTLPRGAPCDPHTSRPSVPLTVDLRQVLPDCAELGLNVRADRGKRGGLLVKAADSLTLCSTSLPLAVCSTPPSFVAWSQAAAAAPSTEVTSAEFLEKSDSSTSSKTMMPELATCAELKHRRDWGTSLLDVLGLAGAWGQGGKPFCISGAHDGGLNHRRQSGRQALCILDLQEST